MVQDLSDPDRFLIVMDLDPDLPVQDAILMEKVVGHGIIESVSLVDPIRKNGKT